MKFFETKFEDYIQKVEQYNIHEYISPVLNEYSKNIENLEHLIFYGSQGIGKYSQALYFIKNFSDSELKYERKITHNFNNKYNYTFKISDIHFEIDMQLLGCYSKLLFNDLYYHILDVCNTMKKNTVIILCKNFHKIHPELLDIFYSYMHDIPHKNINFKYIFLTENISFIPRIILNKCNIVHFEKPSMKSYKKIFKKRKINIKLDNVENLKDLKSKIIKPIENKNKQLVFSLYKCIIDYKNIDFIYLRDSIYNLFIFDYEIQDCLLIILSELIKENRIDNIKTEKIFTYISNFLKKFNNNYRPIFHAEQLIFSIIKTVHDL